MSGFAGDPGGFISFDLRGHFREGSALILVFLLLLLVLGFQIASLILLFQNRSLLKKISSGR